MKRSKSSEVLKIINEGIKYTFTIEEVNEILKVITEEKLDELQVLEVLNKYMKTFDFITTTRCKNLCNLSKTICTYDKTINNDCNSKLHLSLYQGFLYIRKISVDKPRKTIRTEYKPLIIVTKNGEFKTEFSKMCYDSLNKMNIETYQYTVNDKINKLVNKKIENIIMGTTK